jgi:hypothetical protein
MNPRSCSASFVVRLFQVGIVLVFLLALLGPTRGKADEASSGPAPKAPVSQTVLSADLSGSPLAFAEGLSMSKFFSGMNNRGRVVQVCIVTMCIALFILMRKFTEGAKR